jgi:23S rRNA pseudouridine955/2504/2580 synthase
MLLDGKKTFQVSKDQEGLRLLSFLHLCFKDTHSMKQLKKRIDARLCSVNGVKERFATRRLKGGDSVTVSFSPLRKEPPAILFSDPYLLIINKTVGMVCDSREIKTLFPKESLFLVHRLDKETSGALILARSLEIQKKMEDLFRYKAVKKYYLAILRGFVSETEGVLDFYLKRSTREKEKWTTSSEKKGLCAITRWKQILKNRDYTAVLCQPITGRTHQIRVHFQAMGYPLLGDIKYSLTIPSEKDPCRHLLHAYLLDFPHPVSNDPVKIIAAVPEDFSPFIPSIALSNPWALCAF